MNTISESMTQDHRRCDEIFIKLENAVTKKDWEEAMRLTKAFEQAMAHHFAVEEFELFPAMEAATPQAAAPIRVMTMDHDQIRHMIGKLLEAVVQASKDNVLSIAETLLMTIQQHNIKEENMLYPLADRYLSEVSDRIAVSIQETV